MWSTLVLLELAALPAACEVPPERGVALGLFSQDPSYDYSDLIDEIVQLRASHLEVVWVWWQHDASSTLIAPVEGMSPSDQQILDTIAYAAERGLHVTGFPIVRLSHRGADEWRGRLKPEVEDHWWRSYEAYILHSADLTAAAGGHRLTIGSELLTREPMRERWLDLIDRLRLGNGHLQLMYSANWDHFRPVSFWDAVDVVGMTGYWELTRNLGAEQSELEAAWRTPLAEVKAWSRGIGRPVVLTEIGYPSLDGGAAWPWDETRDAPVDLEEQARAYRAFVEVWSHQPELGGVYFWNWFGFGGEEDRTYTPRGKPAAGIIRRWYGGGNAGKCTSRR